MTQDETEDLKQTSALIKGPFELEGAETPASEAELLAILAEKIGYMLETQPEYLMSLLYRLDVLEYKINRVMHPAAPEPAHIGLARLVLERQKQRMETKKNFQTPSLDDYEDWSL
jgi:hypothetical protein